MIGDFGLSVTQKIDLTIQGSFSCEEKNNSTPFPSNVENGFDKLGHSMTKNIGTPLYLAPEQERGGNYDEKVDVYALGLILLEMFTVIKTGHERFKLFNDLKKSHFIPEILQKSYQNEANLILLMTTSNPKDRPSSEKIEKCKEFQLWKETICRK